MKPVYFDGWNAEFAKNQPEYIPLPAKISDDGRMVSTEWKPSFKEKLLMLFGKNVSLSVMTFGAPLQPLKVEVIP